MISIPIGFINRPLPRPLTAPLRLLSLEILPTARSIMMQRPIFRGWMHHRGPDIELPLLAKARPAVVEDRHVYAGNTLDGFRPHERLGMRDSPEVRTTLWGSGPASYAFVVVLTEAAGDGSFHQACRAVREPGDGEASDFGFDFLCVHHYACLVFPLVQPFKQCEL